jgi:hypothetical protein
MNENILYTLSLASFIWICIIVSTADYYDNKPFRKKKLRVISSLISLGIVIFLLAFSIEASEEKYKIATYLKYEGTVYPKYVFEYKEYRIFHPLLEQSIKTYQVENCDENYDIFENGVKVYRFIYPKVFGFIEQKPNNSKTLLFTCKTTPEIQSVLMKQTIELNK